MMRSLCLLASAATALAANGFIKREFETEYVRSLEKRELPTQDLDEPITLGSMRSLYWLDVEIGTPPQPFRLQLDTGSSNLWVPDTSVPECSEQNGCPGGAFNPKKSSTYQNIISGVFDIEYADGTGSSGDYFTDAVTVGEAKIPQGVMSIGLARTLQDGAQLVNDGQGLVGVGYQSNMAGLQYLVTDQYTPPTLIQALVRNGDIDRQAYSLYLNDEDNGKGVIIFGGVDSTKYTGELTALQVLPTDNGVSNYSAFNVALTGISVKDASGTRLLTQPDFNTPALFDSGTTITYIPQNVFNAVSGGFGVVESYGPCSWANSDAALIYHFGGDGGPSISVPLHAMLDPSDGTTFDDGTEACYFNVASENEGSATLGDSFMRSGYFVYDLDNNVVAIAQVQPNVTTEDITSIPSGTAIPGCTSTNTLIISQAAAATEPLGPADTGAATPTGSVLPGTPTFDLGSAATAASTSGSGSSGGSGGSGSSQGAAVSLRVGGWTLAAAAAAAVAVGMLAL